MFNVLLKKEKLETLELL